MNFYSTGLGKVICLILSLQIGVPAFVWAGPTARDLAIEEMQNNVTLWVLSVGVSRYAEESINLKFADHDAERIAEVLKTQEGVLFNKVNTLVLTDKQATRGAILQGMSQFLSQAAEDDVVLIFLAGHGLQDRQTGTYYFVPHNANAENLIYEGLPMPMFEEGIKRLQSFVKKLVLWTDTCHAGAFAVGARSGINIGDDVAAALSDAEGRYILSASRAGEESYEDAAFRLDGEDRGHGAFTFALLKGLQGGAADDRGIVWVSDLFKFVNRDVALTSRGRQHPWNEMRGTDMPLFAVKREGADGGGVAAAASPALAASVDQPTGRRWLYLLLGLGVAGGAVIVLSATGTDGGGATPKGDIVIRTPVPE